MRGPRKSRWPTPAHATHAVVRIGPVACNYPQIRPSTSSVPQQHRPLTVSGPQQIPLLDIRPPANPPDLALRRLANCHATQPADRAAGLAGGHAGRLDPAASHRPVPTARPGQLAGSTASTNFSSVLWHPPAHTARGPRDSTSRSGCGASRRTCRPARPSSLPSACADGTAGAAGWEYREHQLQQRAVAPTCTYRERATRLNQPIGLRG